MEVIKVGICLDDRTFGQALAIGLAREAAGIRFYILDRPEAGAFCDLILSSGPGDDERFVEMVRDPAAQNNSEPPYRVYRYKESQNLINDLLFIYFRKTGKVLENCGSANCRLVLFLAEGGGCGTTSMALSSARMLYQIYGSRSLYMNLCPIDDSKKYLEDGGEESLLKLLYYLDQNRNFPIESFITETEEVDYVNTNVINTYFNEMKPNLMNRFLEKVDKLGKYDFLIVDIGNHLSRENKKLLSGADCVVLISDGQRIRPGRYRERISEEITKRVERGKLLYVKNFAGDDWNEEDSDKLCVTRQEDSDLRLIRNYGNEIGIIAKEIMEGSGHGRT